jgi:hypothetical protein
MSEGIRDCAKGKTSAREAMKDEGKERTLLPALLPFPLAEINEVGGGGGLVDEVAHLEEG